jgi:phage terminase large subunit
MPATLERPLPGQRAYQPYGAAEELLYCRDPEIILSGPAGTGKSRACLEKLHICAANYPGMRGLMLRKTRTSLTQSGIVTFQERVLPEDWQRTIHFHHQDQEYRYPNGSKIVVGGLDKTAKVMSTEYDIAYVQEAVELVEDEWEKLSTRMRNGVLPYQQIIADTNPDAPSHWIKQRANRGQLKMVESRHEDNPTVTTDYLAKLDALTGVRYKRLRLGLWVAAEGQVYESWDPSKHLINRVEIPSHWPRYISVDFGYVNPFVAQWWAVDDDGRMYRYREIYRTQRLVEDHARDIKRFSQGETIRAMFCDHDAEGRATLEKHAGITASPARKAISEGIQEVQARLRAAAGGKPRAFFMRDSLVERDEWCMERKLPCSTEEEIESYVWDTRNNRKKGEEPVDANNHGMDAFRYAVMGLASRRMAIALPGGSTQRSKWR